MSLSSVFDDLCAKTPKARREGDGWYSGLCLAHEADGNGHKASLRFRPTDEVPDGAIVSCMAGCAGEHLHAAYGLGDDVKVKAIGSGEHTFLFFRPSDNGNGSGGGDRPLTPPAWTDRDGVAHQVTERYAYRDETGKVLVVVARCADKVFPVWNPGERHWRWGSAPRVLYHLPVVAEARRTGSMVYVGEGEKDVHTLERHGLVATCNPGGAGKWRPEYAQSLKGARVAILPDNDDPGRKHAEQVKASLDAAGVPCAIVNLPGLPDKGDVSDFIAAGAPVDYLVSLAEEALAAAHPKPLFRTAAQLAAETPEQVAWNWHGYIARSSITELTAKAKAGKTRLLLELVGSLTAGLPFLEMPTTRTPVVYLSEERPGTLRNALERAGLTDCENLHIMLRQDASELDWPTVCETAVQHAHKVGAGLLIVDTLPDWASLSGDSENEAGAALDAVRPLHMAAASGLAVLVCRHERKGGGEIGENARGSSAFGGAVDILMTLRRQTTPGHETRRELQALGRFDETPANLIIELDAAGRYIVVGDTLAVERQEAREALLDHLADDEAHAITEADLLAACGEDVKRSTARNALHDLLDAGEVERAKGSGAASARAYGYWRPCELTDKPPDALSVAMTSPPSPVLAVEEAPLPTIQESGGSPTQLTRPLSL